MYDQIKIMIFVDTYFTFKVIFTFTWIWHQTIWTLNSLYGLKTEKYIFQLYLVVDKAIYHIIKCRGHKTMMYDHIKIIIFIYILHSRLFHLFWDIACIFLHSNIVQRLAYFLDKTDIISVLIMFMHEEMQLRKLISVYFEL